MLTLRGAICALALFSAACAAHAPATARPVAQAPVAAAQPAPVAQPARPPSDPVVDLIAVSTRHFEAGQKELQDGHLESAKTAFNRALDVLLESPFGARTVHTPPVPLITTPRTSVGAPVIAGASDIMLRAFIAHDVPPGP